MNSSNLVDWSRTHAEARVPTKGTHGSAGYDLFAIESVTLQPGKNIIDTHVRIAMGKGYYGHICPRSGLAFNHSISVLGGIVDFDFRGSIKVMLYNPNDYSVPIPKGQAIAQILFLPCINNIEFHEVDELSSTERGSGGFGSTDKK